MLRNPFKKSPVQTIEQPASEIELLGPPQGDGLNQLRIEIAVRLRRFPVVDNACLARLRYKASDESHLGLVISAAEVSTSDKLEIARGCSGIVPMDISFTDELPEALLADIEARCLPLFVPGLSLFECPLIVGKGCATDIPPRWEGATIFWYVAAAEYKNALLTAAEQARALGYEFRGLLDGKVNQMDHLRWWDGHVFEKWPEYAEHLPSQELMDAIVATGGYVRGPAIGFDGPAASK